MALAVTQTGNHYLADSLAGAAVALLALLVAVVAWRRAASARAPGAAAPACAARSMPR